MSTQPKTSSSKSKSKISSSSHSHHSSYPSYPASSEQQNHYYPRQTTSRSTNSYFTPTSTQQLDHKTTSSWTLPYTIDDSDLMFDGKPLNLLYEENRWEAEHSRDEHYYSSSSSSGSSNMDIPRGTSKSRGRSRSSKK